MSSGSHGSPSTETTSAGEEDASSDFLGSAGTDSSSAGEEEAYPGSIGNNIMSSGSPRTDLPLLKKNTHLQVILTIIYCHVILLVHQQLIELLLVTRRHMQVLSYICKPE